VSSAKPFTLLYTDSYDRRARKFLNRRPDLLNAYRKTLELLELDPTHPALRLHALKGRLKGLPSVSINISYRIVLQFLVEGRNILLINVGSHEDVY